jgi:glycosyltransferase involved in cell wall biosynthesis
VKLASVLLGITKPIIFIGCPPALEVAKKLGGRYLVYLRIDLFEEMPEANKCYIASLDDELTRSADLVLYVNRALWKQGMNKNKNSLLIRHGVDFDLFANAAKSMCVPSDIAKIPRPTIGFFGDISDKTSDIALLEFVAERLPDMSLVFVGSISADVSRLKQFRNVHFLGQKPYNQVPFYGKEFDVAIMPWNRSRWIKFCNPIKLKEYLALGKPVVSTYYPEIEPYSDVVYVARDYDEFISCLHAAIEEGDPAKAEDRRKNVQDETWDSKVEQIKAAIEKGLN